MRTFARYLAHGLLLLALAVPAFAETPEESITRQLKAQGFTSITVSRTLLGRMRFVAQMDGTRREIIYNPRTGEILRDYSESTGSATSGPTLFQPGPPSGGATGSPDESDSQDDGHDDEGGSSEGGGDDGSGDGGESSGEGEGEGGGEGEGEGEGDGGDD